MAQEYKFENISNNPISLEIMLSNDKTAEPKTLRWGIKGDLNADRSPAHIVSLSKEEYEAARKRKAFEAYIDTQSAHRALVQVM